MIIKNLTRNLIHQSFLKSRRLSLEKAPLPPGFRHLCSSTLPVAYTNPSFSILWRLLCRHLVPARPGLHLGHVPWPVPGEEPVRRGRPVHGGAAQPRLHVSAGPVRGPLRRLWTQWERPFRSVFRRGVGVSGSDMASSPSCLRVMHWFDFRYTVTPSCVREEAWLTWSFCHEDRIRQ